MAAQDPHSFSDTSQGRIRHLDIDVEVDFASRALRGRVDYEISEPRPGPLWLDTRDVQIVEVSAGSEKLAWEIDQTDRIKGQRLVVHNEAGFSRFRIAFCTSPQASALGWLEPGQTAGGRHPFVLTQCQAIHARSVFPCQDTPGVRFTYDARVTVPAPLTAAMSAERLDVHQSGARRICCFRMPQSIPSYLFALAVGDLEFQSLGPRSGLFAEPEMLERAVWEFEATEAMIRECERLFGPYLWDTFHMLILPPSFPYGGMENPRLTFLTPTILVGDRSMVSLVAHELAHSWTGNLVTNATWEDFWLNEGWTVYAERRILEVLEGRALAELLGAVRRENMLEDMRLFGMQSDATKLKYPQDGVDPDEVYSSVPYEKGCALLTLIEHCVGRPKFDEFTRTYIDRFRFQSITTERFLEFLRGEFPEIDQRIDLQQWVYGAGFPQDAPGYQSPLLDDVREKVQQYASGKRLNPTEVSTWKPQQVEVFLKHLPRAIAPDECVYLRDLFRLDATRNKNLLTEYLVLAIRSGITDVEPQVEQLVSSVGRLLYLKPLYRALVETGWSRDRARPMFDRCRRSYHPIAVAALERILANHAC